MSDDLVEWLRAQLDDDERMARAAGWHQWDLGIMYGTVIATGNRKTVARDCLGYDAEHIANFDPARVPREIEAKRRILDRYEDCVARFNDPGYSPVLASEQMREYEDFVLPALAAIYSDRPGYRENWRPA